MFPENILSDDHISLISDDVTFEPFYIPRTRNPKSLLTIRNIIKAVKKHNPSLCHIQANGHHLFFLAFPFLKKYPIVNTIHDPKPHLGEDKLRKRVMINAALKNTNQFITHGEILKYEIIRNYHIPERKIHVIPLGNLAIFKKWQMKEVEEIPNTILYFGRIWKYKGLDYLIRAEPLISKEIPNIKFIIAGRGEKFDKYEKMIVNKDKFIIKNKYVSNEEIT